MTIQRPTIDFNLHAILCIITIILGVLVFAKVVDVNLDQGVGLILAALGVLLLL